MTGIITDVGTKGFGFIKGKNNKRYFFHMKEIHNRKRVAPNMEVEFMESENDKGLVAIRIFVK